MKNKYKSVVIAFIAGMCTYFAANFLLNKCIIFDRVQNEKITDVSISKSVMQDMTESTSAASNAKTSVYKGYSREFQKRRDQVHYICNVTDGIKKKVISIYHKAIENMIVDTDHGLTWCPVYKAASTMWMKNFALLSGVSLSKTFKDDKVVEYSAIVKQKFQRTDKYDDKLKKMEKTIKFMIVRHPFERLLSAYRDKLEHIHDRQYYYTRYGKYIRKKYRPLNSNLTSLEPTFEEFLQFIAKEKFFDEHWVPFFNSCQPCSIDYDYIVKFEHYEYEYDILIKELNLVDNYLEYTQNGRENTSSQGITNDLVSAKYFHFIPESLLFSIYKIYELDFILFSYSPLKYYAMSKYHDIEIKTYEYENAYLSKK